MDPVDIRKRLRTKGDDGVVSWLDTECAEDG